MESIPAMRRRGLIPRSPGHTIGGDNMKKLLCAALSALFLCSTASAAKPQPRYAAMTFDDGPSAKTPRLLEGLAKRNAHATFFVCGYRVEQFPETLVQIREAGHEIGMHGYSHRYFTELSPAELYEELTTLSLQITEMTGFAPTLVRPPGGLSSTEVLRDSPCADYPVILWGVDTMDWNTKDAVSVCRKITKSTRCGSVILMHDTSESSVDAALSAIDCLQAQGYVFLTVSELAEQMGYALLGGHVYFRFPPKTPESALALPECCLAQSPAFRRRVRKGTRSGA